MTFGGLFEIKLYVEIKCYESSGKIVFENLNLTLKEGDYVVVYGKSGSGKSTLLKMLATFDRKYRGTLHYFTEDTLEIKREKELSKLRIDMISFVFQDFKLIRYYTIGQNFEVVLRLLRIEKREFQIRIAEVMSRVNLNLSYLTRLPHSLSGGEKQRVAIARALLTRPRILFADEPTASLDPENSKLILELLQSISSDKIIVVVASHDDIVRKNANVIVSINEGDTSVIYQ